MSEPLTKRSANIFINYRREDSAGHAGRLFDHMSGRFPGRVFMDIDTIEPGIDFVEVIEKAVGYCEVLIVVIGDQWLHAVDGDGRRRLDNPSDFVRLEIASALERKIRVIPVLVKSAAMPRPEDLPPDLAKLTRRNAIELSDARFAFDMDRLIQAIEAVLQEKAPSALMPAYTPSPAPQAEAPAPRKRARRFATALFVILGLLGLAWASWRYGILHNLLGSGKTVPWSNEAPAATPPAASPAVEREAREPAGRITPRTARPPKEATPRKDEPGKFHRWWDSTTRKLLGKPASGPEKP